MPYVLLMEYELNSFLSINSETKHLFIMLFTFTISVFLPTKLTS